MKILTSFILATCLLAAQDVPAPPKQESLQATIIPITTLTGDSFDRLVNLLGVFNARLSADRVLRTIVVYAPREVVTEIRKVISELDKPGSQAAIGRNIDMTMSFLRASAKPLADAAPLPADLESVARQIRATTQYKNIALWDVVPMRVQEGREADQSLNFPTAGTTMATIVSIQVHPDAVTIKDKDRSVRFGQVRIRFRIPVASEAFGPEKIVTYQYTDTGIQTAGDFSESQKTVLGKVSSGNDESAIFVVVSLKILD